MSESETTPKGSFQADISQDVINEALRSVESSGATDESVQTEVEGEGEIGELEKLRAELELKERLLEESIARAQQVQQHLAEANDLRLRAAADLENYKKRAARELEETRKFGIEKLLVELLPVLDNLDRALEAVNGPNPEISAFAEGIRMNRRLFEETLARFGVKGFSAVGETFDPRFHEAIQQVESQEHPANVVVQELVRGYMLHERLVRPALVVVSAGPGPAGPAADDAA